MQIRDWILKIIIIVSAFVCSIKRKNMILHMVLEFFYLVVIMALPVFVITLYICAILGNEAVNFISVGKYIGIGIFGCCYYYVFINRKSENNIEKYLLKLSLSIDEYYRDEKRIKIQKRHIIGEYANFLILFIFIIWVLGSLSSAIGFKSIKAGIMCIILGFLVAYILYIYANQDETIRKERKTYIGIVVTLVWLIIVGIRLNKYFSDNIKINSEDSALLVFSMIFTFPTIFAWIKNIPRKINEPYKDKVEKRSQELIEIYSWYKLRNKVIEQVVGYFLLCKTANSKLKEEWKLGNKKKVVFFWIYLLIAVIVIIGVIWLSKYIPLKIETDTVSNIIMDFYNQLSINVKGILKRIFVGAVLIGIMILFLVKLPKVLSNDRSKSIKLKSILTVVIWELLLGYIFFILILK